MHRKPKIDVFLNVYDLAPSNDYTHDFGLGAYHSGVEILGTEYTFGQGMGVGEMTPKEVPNAKFRESIKIGEFEGRSGDVKSVVSELRSDFPGDSYNVLTKNCNCFADELCRRLTGNGIPGYVNRLAYFGSVFSCLLPPDLNNDPTQQNGTGRSSVPKSSTPSFSAFGGSGQTLSGSAPPSSQSSSGVELNDRSDLTDRREKMRMAAMARFEAKPVDNAEGQ